MNGPNAAKAATVPADIHALYHEAQKRASQPQPVMKHRRAKSLLLSSPNNIIFELFNTIIKELSADVLLDFVTKNLKRYLDANWQTKITQQAIRRLKREQTVDVRAGLIDAPLIKISTGILTAKGVTTIIDYKSVEQQRQTKLASPTPLLVKLQPATPCSTYEIQRNPPMDRETATKHEAIEQIYEHIMWRIRTDNVTQITSLLVKLVLDDGYKRKKLKVDAYDEVADCFTDWRSLKLIKLYSFGAAPANDQRLILANTTLGDLTKWIANYIDGSEKRQKPELLRILATALRDKTKNCILITNELIDAMNGLETGAIRCAFLVDRLNHYEPIQSMPHFNTQIEPLITSGKLYIMSSLNCVEFVPDPNNDTCC